MRLLNPSGWRRPVGYANGLLTSGDGDIVFVAGMIGWDEKERLVASDLVGQFEQALANVLEVVREGGGGPTDVAQMTVFVTDVESYARERPRIGQVWRAEMGSHYPAMALVEVRRFVERDALVEIQAIAVIGPRSRRKDARVGTGE